MTCVECWAEFSIGDCIELLNVVRNRVLDFSLELWKANPAVGESNSDAQELLSEDGITQSVNQTFNTTVHEGNIMADNTISKLRVSRAEASEKISSQIDRGKDCMRLKYTLNKTLVNYSLRQVNGLITTKHCLPLYLTNLRYQICMVHQLSTYHFRV